MRDSIGGTLLFWIVLFLFSIFIVFIAFIIKYARVYRMKNTMINYIERNEGIATQVDFENRLKMIGYPTDGQYKVCRYLLPEKGGYYYLELYSMTQFPVVGNLLSIKITIKGETTTINTGTVIRNDQKGGISNGWFFGSGSECKFCTLHSNDLGSCVAVDAD